jgi:DNA repair ATPase RecN
LSDLESELQGIIVELSRLLLQLNTFISQFHNFVIETGINVVTDASGALGIDVSGTLDDAIAQQYANRIEVLDSLIHNHIHSIENLLKRASEIEAQIMVLNGGYESQLAEFSARLTRLINSYRH